VSEPAGSVVDEKVATPDELGVAVPRAAPPLENVTVPGEVPVGAGVMVAVSVTLCPKVAGLGEAASVVVVGATLTVKLRAVEVEGPKAVFPE
jgi:hypothetical protein